MSRCRNLLLLITCFSFLASGSAQAHTLFKKSIEKAYPTMKVSCNACHVKDESKEVRNDFGELFHKELKDDKVTENWKAAKAEGGKPAQKEYEKDTMIPLFEKALKKIQKATVPEVEGEENPNAGKSYDELIKSEKIDGIKIDPRKVEKMKKEAEAAGGSESKETAGSGKK